MSKRYYVLAFLLICSQIAFSQNIMVDDFEQYANTDSLKTMWRVFGYSSLDFGLVSDTVNSPHGNQYLEYVYSGNSQTTWGGAVDMKGLANAPLNLSSANAGLEFYVKGDGSSNKFYVQIKNGTSAWVSNLFSLSDTNWHPIIVPFAVDTSNGFTNGSKNLASLQADLMHVTDLAFYVSHPTIDNVTRRIYFDAIYAVQHLPPSNAITLENWESYQNTDSLKLAWQFFGYSTLDYELLNDPQNAPTGFKYIDYMYQGNNQTTWGGAMRTRHFTPTNLDSMKGIQFYLKGDGSTNRLNFVFYSGTDMWSSYYTPLADTTWHLIRIPFIVDSTKGFRYLGNNTGSPVYGSNIGTIAKLDSDLANVTEIRMYVYFPVIDFVKNVIYVGGIYAVNQFSPYPPVTVDDFGSYGSTSDLLSVWQPLGDANTSLTLTSNPDSVAVGSVNAAVMTYKCAPGTHFSSMNKGNILPALNLSTLSGGMQFWLKGDGTYNKIILRLFNGSEMWASNAITLHDTTWQLLGIPFTADSTSGFRYLGNDPNNPTWSSNVGTTQQLYGDLASIDQVVFEVLNPAPDNTPHSVVIDAVQGVDAFASNAVATAINGTPVPSVAKQFSLQQNYPNPFNPSTIIQYNLPQRGVVTLRVYNVLGQLVTTLVNGMQQAGVHTVAFNGERLASGVYFYSIRAGSFMSTKKMLFLK